MRITELLDKRSIRIDGAPKSKNEALDQMVELMAKSGKINDLEAYRQEVYRREEEDLPKLIGFLKRQETNGKFFSKAMQKELVTDMEEV